MNGFLRTLVFSCWLFAFQQAFAEDSRLDFYGELDVSYDQQHPGTQDWRSNSSRLGLRGKLKLGEYSKFIYQLEHGIDPVRGGLNRDTLLSMRNTFVGVEHARFGTLVIGTHDSPLKLAQGKADVFNDQLGDIQTLLTGEVRARDSIMYTSPRLGGIVTARFLFIPPDDDFGNSHSLSLEYQEDKLFWAVGADVDMRKNDQRATQTVVFDAFRGTLMFPLGSWQLGTLVQTSRNNNPGTVHDWEFGYILSASTNLTRYRLLAQYGAADILAPDMTQLSLGISTFIVKDLRVYAIASFLTQGASDRDGVSLGIEYKF